MPERESGSDIAKRLQGTLQGRGINAEVVDEQLMLLRRLIASGMQPSTLATGSDRLRPPYMSPLPGGVPANAPASRDLEVGWNRLPPEYQALLMAAQPRTVNVGTFPPGWNVRGILEHRTTPPSISAVAPQTMAHELIHELIARRGDPLERQLSDLNEDLARRVAGQDPYSGHHFDADVIEKDRQLRAEGYKLLPKQPGWLETVLNVLRGLMHR